MKSFESMPPQEEKWTNASYRNCAQVYDVLAKLERANALPEGKTSDDPSLAKAGDIMDYAERVLADDQFWATVPEDVPTQLEGDTVKKDDLKTMLSEIIEESR
jgi:hypothetical protein